MKTFNTTFNTTLDTQIAKLATIWNDKKVLSEREKAVTNNLFFDIDKIVRNEADAITNETELATFNNTVKILLDDYTKALDAKKDIKKIRIVNLLKFVAVNNIKIHLYTTNKGKDYMLPISVIKNLVKFEVSKSQISKANKIYSRELDKDINKKYADMLRNAVDKAKKEKYEIERDIAIKAGINSLSHNNDIDTLNAIYNVIGRKIAELNAKN